MNLNGRNGILGSHITFGDPRRGWNFVSPGHGDVDFDKIIRVLKDVYKRQVMTIAAVLISVMVAAGACGKMMGDAPAPVSYTHLYGSYNGCSGCPHERESTPESGLQTG